MSKSLGNFITIRDALAEAPGEVNRLVLLSTHYRHPMDWTADGSPRPAPALDRLYTALRNAGAAADGVDGDTVDPEVEAALCDDLNTPKALAALHRLAGALNRAGDEAAKARACVPRCAAPAPCSGCCRRTPRRGSAARAKKAA